MKRKWEGALCTWNRWTTIHLPDWSAQNREKCPKKHGQQHVLGQNTCNKRPVSLDQTRKLSENVQSQANLAVRIEAKSISSTFCRLLGAGHVLWPTIVLFSSLHLVHLFFCILFGWVHVQNEVGNERVWDQVWPISSEYGSKAGNERNMRKHSKWSSGSTQSTQTVIRGWWWSWWWWSLFIVTFLKKKVNMQTTWMQKRNSADWFSFVRVCLPNEFECNAPN